MMWTVKSLVLVMPQESGLKNIKAKKKKKI